MKKFIITMAVLVLVGIGYAVVLTGDQLSTSGSQKVFTFPDITSTIAELNGMDGVTATALELNALDASSTTAITAGHTNVTLSVKTVDILATDTTISRASAGDIAVEGNTVYRAGGTDVPVTDGGTGASTLTDGGVLLGNATGALVAMSVLADGEMIVGDGTTDPVAESGATLRTSIGVGTTDSPAFNGLTVTGSLASATIVASGPIKAAFADSASNPALVIGTSTNGFEDESASQLGIVINGVRIGDIRSDGLHVEAIQGYLSGKGAEIQYSSWEYTTNAIVLGANDLNQIQWIRTNAAVAITLPTNGVSAGCWVDVAVHSTSSDDCAPTISAATADTLIGPNDIDLKSVTWGTGNRIGAYARFISDGTYWHVQNLGGTTMTYND